MKIKTAILYSDTEAVKIENSSFPLKPSLISFQEKADKKVMLHTKLLLEVIL